MATGMYLGAKGLKLDDLENMISKYNSLPQTQEFIKKAEISIPALIQVPYDNSKSVLMAFQTNTEKLKTKNPGKESFVLLDNVLNYHFVNMSNYIASLNKKEECDGRNYLAAPVDSSLGESGPKHYELLVKSSIEDWGKPVANFTRLGFSDNGLDKETFNSIAQTYYAREKEKHLSAVNGQYDLIKHKIDQLSNYVEGSYANIIIASNQLNSILQDISKIKERL